jgi:hypothetical protein
MKQFTARFKGTQTSLETSMQARLQLFVQNRRLILSLLLLSGRFFQALPNIGRTYMRKAGHQDPAHTIGLLTLQRM